VILSNVGTFMYFVDIFQEGSLARSAGTDNNGQRHVLFFREKVKDACDFLFSNAEMQNYVTKVYDSRHQLPEWLWNRNDSSSPYWCSVDG